MTAEAQAEEWLEYYIHIGAHPNGTQNRFAVMAFLDYEQIPIDGEDQWVLYADMLPGTQATVPARLQAPEEPGIYELMLIYVYNPFSMLEEPALGDNRRATPIIDGAYATIRTAIVVR